MAAFEQALDSRFPDNRILSHDLLESCYARSGLITDVQLYEEYPLQYIADMQRRHRWIRGDWQIVSWVFPFVQGYDRKLHKNPLSLLSKWKIFDNVRRSLVPISFLLLFVFGWVISPSPWFWTTALMLIIAFSAIELKTPLKCTLVTSTWAEAVFDFGAAALAWKKQITSNFLTDQEADQEFFTPQVEKIDDENSTPQSRLSAELEH